MSIEPASSAVTPGGPTPTSTKSTPFRWYALLSQYDGIGLQDELRSRLVRDEGERPGTDGVGVGVGQVARSRDHALTAGYPVEQLDAGVVGVVDLQREWVDDRDRIDERQVAQCRIELVVEKPGLHRIRVEGLTVRELHAGAKVERDDVAVHGPAGGEARFQAPTSAQVNKRVVYRRRDDRVAVAGALRRIERVGELGGEVIADAKGPRCSPAPCSAARRQGHARCDGKDSPEHGLA